MKRTIRAPGYGAQNGKHEYSQDQRWKSPEINSLHATTFHPLLTQEWINELEASMAEEVKVIIELMDCHYYLQDIVFPAHWTICVVGQYFPITPAVYVGHNQEITVNNYTVVDP